MTYKNVSNNKLVIFEHLRVHIFTNSHESMEIYTCENQILGWGCW